MAKYKAYPEYKDSGVHWFDVKPLSWKVTRLKLESFMNMGQSPSSDDCNIEGDGLAFLQGNAEFGKVNPVEKQYCPVAKKIANPGDILFSVRAPVGAMNFADKKYGIGRGLCSIAASAKVTSPFLWWLLPTYKYQLDAIATGSTFEAVSAEQLGNLCFALPSISEQRQIATFLDHETAKIDNLIEKQQQLIELLKEKRQAVISHAVTKGLNPDVPMKDSGVEWLGEVPEHWVSVRVKQISSFITSGPRGWSDFITDEGNEIFLQSGDLNNELGLKLDKAKRVSPPKNAEGVRTKLVAGDVVVCITGANTGRVAIVPELSQSTYINQHLSLIRPNTSIINSAFLGYSLASSVGRSFFDVAQYGLKEGLSLGNVSEAPLALPPKHEQDVIVKYLESIRNNYDNLSRLSTIQIELLKERRTALISAAVTGKIDVRDWVAPDSSEMADIEGSPEVNA
ncbi:restriction endonuclease subunit S [Dickeya oryzae]|uniref:restriction endonuclease subunit S n=1 Tax=Dickeya oryzae TaxID=1240404 RepID=UPI0012957EEF|nr:restriction endonuclease subunit S [Dickeya oryzae]